MKTSAPSAVSFSSKLSLGNRMESLFQIRSKKSVIEWPTKEQIQQVSKRLATVHRIGVRSEAKGDYFRSGDLAYQMHEIIRATAELLKKSRRTAS